MKTKTAYLETTAYFENKTFLSHANVSVSKNILAQHKGLHKFRVLFKKILLLMLGIKVMALDMLGKYSTTKLPPGPKYVLF